MSPRRSAIRAADQLAPIELTDDDRIESLRVERRLLAQYASHAGLAKLRARITEINAAINQLKASGSRTP